MQYFKNLFGSVTSPATYQRFMAAPTRQALIHFTLSMLLVGALQGFFLVREYYPQLITGVEENTQAIVASYPTDLTFTWDGQQLIADPAKYHVLPINPAALPIFQDFPSADNETIVYLNEDITAQDAAAALGDYDAAAIVDRHSLFYYSEDTGMSEEALVTYFGDNQFTLNHEMLPGLQSAAVNGVAGFQTTALWLGPVILALLAWMSQFLTSLFLATILFLLGKVTKTMESWTQSWRFTLVLLVVVQLITIAVGFLYPATTVPVQMLAFWLLSAFILFSLKMVPRTKN